MLLPRALRHLAELCAEPIVIRTILSELHEVQDCAIYKAASQLCNKH